MSNPERWLRLLALMLLLLAVFSGCSDGDDDDDQTGADDDDDADDDSASGDDDDNDDTDCPDADEDGFTDAACGGEDCDDHDPLSHPDAAELCTDGRDQDCDGVEDDGCVYFDVETVLDDYLPNEDRRFYSLAYLSDGTPVVAYYAPGPKALGVSVRTAKGWPTRIVDEQGDTGWYASVDVDGADRIGVAYHNATAGDLKVAFKTTAEDWTARTVASQGMTGLNAKLHFGLNDEANVFCMKKYADWYIAHYEEAGAAWNEWQRFGNAFVQISYTFDAHMAPSGFPVFSWPDYNYEMSSDKYGYDAMYAGWYDPLGGDNSVVLYWGHLIDVDMRFTAVTWDEDNQPMSFFITDAVPVIVVGEFTNSWGIYDLPDNHVAPAAPLSADTASDGTVYLAYTNALSNTPRIAYRTNGVLWRFADVFDGDQFGSGAQLTVAPDDLPGVVFLDHTQGALRYAKMKIIPEVD